MRIDLDIYDNMLFESWGDLSLILENIYRDVRWDLGIACDNINFKEGKFSLADYPDLAERVDEIIAQLNARSYSVIASSVQSAWALSNVKNNKLVSLFFKDKLVQLTEELMKRYTQSNADALKEFINRKTNGLKLSDRVWHYNDYFKTQMENALHIGIGNGVSANEMSNYMTKYLRNPSATQFEVDKAGIAKEIPTKNVGPGVYKDPMANAMRLARTETAMAYRTADQVRWSQLDFVVGYEVHLSNNHTIMKGGKRVRFTDVCDFLQGKYPKNFRFTGWHPQCRCYSTPILKTEAEMNRDDELIMQGKEPDPTSKNTITDVPKGFKVWIGENTERLQNSKSLPYFVRDNAEYVKGVEFNKQQMRQIAESKGKNG